MTENAPPPPPPAPPTGSAPQGQPPFASAGSRGTPSPVHLSERTLAEQLRNVRFADWFVVLCKFTLASVCVYLVAVAALAIPFVLFMVLLGLLLV